MRGVFLLSLLARVRPDLVTVGGVECEALYPRDVSRAPHPVAVFFHGGGMHNSSQYAGLFARLTHAGVVVVANMQDPFWPGFPTHAPTYAETIVGNLTTAGLRPTADLSSLIVMGHSMGGIVAQEYAASSFALARPEIKGLVAIHAPSLAPWALPHANASALFLAGSSDFIALPGLVQGSYSLYGARGGGKVFAEVRGAVHTQVLEPDDLGEANASVAACLCFTRMDEAACAAVCALQERMNLTTFKSQGCSR